MSSNTNLNVKILQVAKTTAEWALVDSIISKGLLCVEFVTETGETKLKVGDGVSTYAALPYASAVDLSDYATEEYVGDKISELGNIFTLKGVVSSFEELATKTEGAKAGDVYLVGTPGETADSFEEYVYTTLGNWEYFGKVQTEVDLSGYVQKEDEEYTTTVAAAHTHSNKGILDATTASYTSEEATKLAGLDSDLSTRVEALEDAGYISEYDSLVINCTL